MNVPRFQRLRTLLILGRVSNLPTVWSNCLAAWLLAGGSLAARPHSPISGLVLLLLLCTGCSLLYLAGMVLNDVFDIGFDTVHRPERPIPSGRIRRPTAAFLGSGLLVGGLILLVPLSGWWALALAGTILVYNAVHKHTPLGVPLMAGCRALIYPLVGAACGLSLGWTPLGPAVLAMSCWVLAISILARNETRLEARLSPDLLVLLLLAPLSIVSTALVFCRGGLNEVISPLPLFAFFALQATVIRWRRIAPQSDTGFQPVKACASYSEHRLEARATLGQTNPVPQRPNLVPDLLAAIPLVDLMMVAPRPGLAYLPFFAFTALALFLRRSIPPS